MGDALGVGVGVGLGLDDVVSVGLGLLWSVPLDVDPMTLVVDEVTLSAGVAVGDGESLTDATAALFALELPPPT